MQIQIKKLNKTPLIFLYYGFLLSFSDYEVKLNLSLKAFKNLIQTRDLKLALSLGIFLKKEINYDVEKTEPNPKINLSKNEIKNYYENQLPEILEKTVELKDDDIYYIPISFILLGIRKNVSIYDEQNNNLIKFKKASYDSGTGTIPIFRNKGFSKQIIDECKNFLKRKIFDGFILEVLENNEKAKNLYLSSGFKISRKFHCFVVDKEKLSINLENIINKYKNSINLNFFLDNKNSKFDLNKIKIKNINPYFLFLYGINDKLIEKVSPSRASWQNSLKSVKNIKKDIYFFILYYEKMKIGFSAIQKSNGDIKFLIVDKDFINNKEVLKILNSIFLYEIIKKIENKKISILNVDEKTNLLNFLNSSDFNNFVNQYEMYLII